MTQYAQAVQYPGNNAPIYVQSFPKERIAKQDSEYNIITYRVVKSEMAPWDNEGSRVARGLTLANTERLKDLKNYALKTYLWREWVNVEFSVWSNDNLDADITANWFHGFMMYYAYQLKYFTAQGIQIFKFESRADDDVDHTQEQEIYRRRLNYSFRIDHMFQVQERLLTELSIELENGKSHEVETFALGSKART